MVKLNKKLNQSFWRSTRFTSYYMGKYAGLTNFKMSFWGSPQSSADVHYFLLWEQNKLFSNSLRLQIFRTVLEKCLKSYLNSFFDVFLSSGELRSSFFFLEKCVQMLNCKRSAQIYYTLSGQTYHFSLMDAFLQNSSIF